MLTISVNTELKTMSCPHCAGVFAISQSYFDEARQKGAFAQVWACPYCQQIRGYGKSSVEEEKDALNMKIAELERSKKWSDARREDALKEAAHFRKSRDGIKGALTKERKRVGNGVCPCCNRFIRQLANHMKAKHPHYSISEDVK